MCGIRPLAIRWPNCEEARTKLRSTAFRFLAILNGFVFLPTRLGDHIVGYITCIIWTEPTSLQGTVHVFNIGSMGPESTKAQRSRLSFMGGLGLLPSSLDDYVWGGPFPIVHISGSLMDCMMRVGGVSI